MIRLCGLLMCQGTFVWKNCFFQNGSKPSFHHPPDFYTMCSVFFVLTKIKQKDGSHSLCMLFFVLLHEFQSNGSPPCEGGFSHTCTNILLKAYHNHCLNWVRTGCLSQGILHHLFSRNVLLYSLKFCKKWCYASALLSENRVLHTF